MKKMIAVLVLALGGTQPALAQWQATERIEHYQVTGRTGIDLYRSIGENGPSVGIGRAIAHTSFDLLWSRDYRNRADGSCVLASARPSLTITYRLPRPGNDLPEPVRSNWATFIAGVEAHERVHGDIIKDMTRQIEAVSVGLTQPNDPDCNKVRAELQRQLAGIAAELDRRNREFDQKELSDGGNVHQLILDLVNGG
jgi:predicted secreted Zn-dependent protease